MDEPTVEEASVLFHTTSATTMCVATNVRLSIQSKTCRVMSTARELDLMQVELFEAVIKNPVDYLGTVTLTTILGSEETQSQHTHSILEVEPFGPEADCTNDGQRS